MKKSLKNIFYQWKWFLWIKTIVNPPLLPSLDHLIYLYARETKYPFFLQIGANSLQYSDPLYNYIVCQKWRGILVEPQQKLFNQLIEKFGKNNNLTIEHIAISDQEKDKIFYYLSPKSKEIQLPIWVSQLSSFHKNVPESVLESLPNAIVSELSIKCTTVNKLLQKHHINALDVLMIDTEGHDFIILSSLDFDRFLPSLILYEHHFLNHRDDQKGLSLLRQHGYFLYRDGFNTLAFRSKGIRSVYEKHLI